MSAPQIALSRLAQGAVSFALLIGVACEPDPAGSSAPRSRVQAVLAASTPDGTPAASSNAQSAASGGAPATRTPRPALCAGQLNQPGETFKPKSTPERKGDSGRRLPDNPVVAGKAWTWINFWAAWCVPCKQELPELMRWQRELEGKIHFSFVSLDDDERQLSAFLAEQPDSGLKQSYWLPDGPKRVVWLEALQLDDEPELPLQVLIDPAGRIRCQVQGAVEPDDLATLTQIVSER